MSKEKIILIAAGVVLLVALVLALIFGRDQSVANPNILGAWYSTSADADPLTFYDNDTCTSSIHFSAGTYGFPDPDHVSIASSDGTYTLTLTIEKDENESVTRLTSGSISYVRDQEMATQETDTTYTTSLATYNAQQAFPKILQADAWHCDGSKYNETLTFDPTHVALSWEDGSETHTATWSWIYLSVKAEQDGKPVEVRMQLTPAETDITLDRDTGTVYLYTSDTENGFYITSDLFPTAAGQPAENELVTWRQPTTDETLQAADDSSTEGENFTYSPDGYTADSYAATDDPFSDSFIEPEAGSIDPETDKKIKTYSRVISGDTCTITYIYDDDTKRTETIEREITISPERVNVDYEGVTE